MNEVDRYSGDLMSLETGPFHSAAGGALRFELQLDGELIVNVEPHPGYLHRSIEKICESRTYEQIGPFCSRVDYSSAMTAVLTYSLAVESFYNNSELMVPERAMYLRVVMAEMQRIASHLLWLALFALETGSESVHLLALKEREAVLTLLEEACGQRITTNYPVIGGVRKGLPEGWADKCRCFCNGLSRPLDDVEGLLTDNPIFISRTRGIGVLSLEDAISYGMTGPVARASGLDFDLRRDEPWGPYGKLEFTVPIGLEGDSYARYIVRMAEMRQSATLVLQALDLMPDGPIATGVPRRLEPPASETYFRTEGPRGEFGVFIVSNGTDKPLRIRYRDNSFSAASALSHICKGCRLDDFQAVLASFDISASALDR